MKVIQKKNKHQKNGQSKLKIMKRIFSIVMVFALAFSLLEVSQGRLVVYAEGEAGNAPDPEPGTGSVQNPDDITVSEFNGSNYKATQIMNGNFETTPWESFVYNGKVYDKDPSGLKQVNIDNALPNGIGGGWNTTENKTYEGSLFEVWNIKDTKNGKELSPVKEEGVGRDLTKNGANFIEMNANSPAALYQDLATHGGDIIKWTLQHAARVGLGCKEQRMYVTVGSPEIDKSGKIIAADGVNDNIDTHIIDAGKARYDYNGISQSENNIAFAKEEELKGLSVNKGDRKWCDVAGIYVVPAGQEVTRFAFCADKQVGANNKDLSGGNFLDNITFSTLLGNLSATRQQSSEGNGDVKVTGYWGDKNSNKHLVIEFGGKKETIDMSSVIDKNFEITIPASVIEGATSLDIYHEDYTDATKTINITHKHTWKYEADNEGSGNHEKKVDAYCTNEAPPQCSYGENNKDVYLKLTAYDSEYTGRAYDSARVTEWSIVDNTLDARPDIKYYREDSKDHYVPTNDANSGAASEGAAPKNVGKYYAEIKVGDGDDAAVAKANFEITPKTITKEMVKCKTEFEYNGREQKPSVSIKDGDKICKENEDYKISWSELPKKVGKYIFKVKGNRNYTGEVPVEIKVLQKKAQLTWNPSSFIYNGENQQPRAVVSNLADDDKGKVTVKVTVDGDHKDVKEGGYTAKASLDGDRQGNYTLTEEASKNVFYIRPKQITSDMVEVKEKSYIHNGKDSFTPEITVKDGETILQNDKDYTLSGAVSGSAVGIYKIKVTGIGNYTGVVEDSFEIKDNTKPTGSGSSSGTGGSTGGGSIYPEATKTPDVTETPKPTKTPETTVTPGSTESPKPSDTPKPTVSPTAKPSVKPTAKPTPAPKPVSKPVSKAELEKNSLAINSGLKVSQKGSVINVEWGKVKGADGYKVYAQYCGSWFTEKSLNQIRSGKYKKCVIKKINGKKINLKNNYKVYIRAYKFVNGKMVTLAKSVTAHIVGRKNNKETNAKDIKLSRYSYKLKAGRKAIIKGKTVLVDKNKKPLSDAHTKEFRFATSNNKVATVSEKGVIKAVGKGKCTIYVYARNGYARKVKVTVR